MLKFREMVIERDSHYGKIELPGTPFKFSLTPGEVILEPPSLGNGNEEILIKLGYSENDIKNLYDKKIITAKDSDKII
ncbi:MAG: hypothetical protein QXZ44_00665 [Ferroplasma sp.]